MTAARVALASLALVALLSACGSGGGTKSSTVSTAGADLARGKTVFVEKCGGCHVLKDAGTKGIIGGSLDGLKLKKAFVEQRVRFGGNGMPGFDDTLSDDDIAAVVAYTLKAGDR
jgi:mono/diheme cytochrome c family protein